MAILSKRLPGVVLLLGYLVITLILFSTIGMWLGLLVGHGHSSHEEMSKLLFVFSPLMPFYQAPLDLPYGLLIITFFLTNATWLFSTRIRATNSSLLRRTFAFILPWLTFTLLAMLVTMAYTKPIGYDLIWAIDGWVTDPKYRS